MPGGDGFPDGEEESSSPSSGKRAVQTDQTESGQDPGTSGTGSGSGEEEEAEEQPGRTSRGESSPGCEESGGEQAHEDVDMSSGNDSVGGSRHHHSSANRSPGSTTGSGSTKSSKSATGSSSSSSSFHSAHHTECSEQTEHGRKQTHREMTQTVQEMKKRLPSEKRSRSKASTVEALNYALKCVKQVQANSEYYNLLMSSGLEERRDATVCTLEELEGITSEHTLKNTDTFVVVFSLASGKVVHASEQASSVLHCKRKFLESAKFVELLYHQDVNVFYSHTAQPRLPPWNVGTDSVAVLFECAQVKSFFCRIRGGKDRDGEMRYSPFRITPYLLKVQGLSGEEEPCCLALAERMISGYEAPRIPMDKRIFSTTHSPGCVFLEVDDRAVPLLGYLPQDLIGTSVLTCLHPDDRLLMLAMHRKILKYAGQPPFEHSPIRFRCQNGDYITLDSSWSSFINPWSRKVAFIIGRHKVRTGPLNEDVFAARSKAEQPIMCEDVKELQAMIYKLFLQPVHNNGSSGYGSLGSNGSHEHYISVASSSDSNGNLWEDSHREPMTLQQFCADVNKVKNWGQQAYLDSRRKLTPLGPATAVATAGVHRNTSQGLRLRDHVKQSLQEARKQPHIPSYQQINCVDSIIRYLESCATSALKRKSASLSIATSSSSSMSEEDKPAAVAHEDTVNADAALEGPGALDSQVSAGSATTAAVVGAPLTDITISTEAMSVVSVTSQCSYSSTIVHVPQPESEVTALEDAPMGSEPTDSAPTPARPGPSTSSAAQEELLVVGLTKEVLSAHTQKEEQQFVDRFRHRILQSPYSSYLQQDNSSMAHSHHRADVVRPPNKHKRPKPEDSSDSYGSQPGNYWSLPGPTGAPHSSWPSSESSQPPPSNIGFVPPMAVPMQTAPYFTVVGADQQPMVVQPDQGVQNLQPMHPMTPMMVVLLPSYPMYPGNTGMYLQGMPVPVPGVAPQPPFNMSGYIPPGGHVPHGSPSQGHSPGPTATGVEMGQGASVEVDSIPSPWFGEDLDAAQPTALFSSSRSSSPIQLNLLQEELTKPIEAQNSTAPESLHEHHAKAEESPSDSGNQDAHSTSSEMLDQLLQEDARSGTGSNASGSGSGESGGSLGSGSGLGSNGTSTSHTGSSNSSKYFASNDSSDTSRKARKSVEVQERERTTFKKHVDNPLWSMIKQTPEPVMMTYQIGLRDQAQVLQEDREKLLLMQPMQPWFTQDQKKELAEVHPWIHQHTVPQEINTQYCVSCTSMEPGDELNLQTDSPSPPTPDSSCPQDCPSQDTRPNTDT
ncbi:period circadian protein homolog 3 isoform X2 [Puntigrus tetrazona]|uniref:period circadian protein homolog 3 isoform X2 n=1 Tax=Puntigrus tetrazona TaxID=1606681 RepID=UPI001C89D32E|nr:period circadian protein homolog 3 isoform X2 [Puntigrus tetrazona]